MVFIFTKDSRQVKHCPWVLQQRCKALLAYRCWKLCQNLLKQSSFLSYLTCRSTGRSNLLHQSFPDIAVPRIVVQARSQGHLPCRHLNTEPSSLTSSLRQARWRTVSLYQLTSAAALSLSLSLSRFHVYTHACTHANTVRRAGERLKAL